MINKKSVIFGLLGLAVLMVSFASAAGVIADYTKDRPLKLYPGETQTVPFTIQNLAGDEDIVMRAFLEDDANGMAVLVHEDPTYSVALGERGNVPVRITVPSDATIGDVFVVDIDLRQVSEPDTDGGMVTLVGGMGYKMGVVITSMEESSFYDASQTAPATATEEEASNTLWYIIAAIIIVVIILYFVTKKKK